VTGAAAVAVAAWKVVDERDASAVPALRDDLVPEHRARRGAARSSRGPSRRGRRRARATTRRAPARRRAWAVPPRRARRRARRHRRDTLAVR
jgi:hypothetical protein